MFSRKFFLFDFLSTSTFSLQQTVSLSASVRFRLCELVNLILDSLPDDGDIEEFHCDDVLSYMVDRLKVRICY